MKPKRSRRSRAWTGHVDKNGVLIMKGDTVIQKGIRGGCYNNEDRKFIVYDTCGACAGLFSDGYRSAPEGVEVIL